MRRSGDYSIITVLQAYYRGAPARIGVLQRRQQWVDRRIAELEAELSERDRQALRELRDFTIPGTVASYDGPAARSNAVGNPTLTAVIRLKAVEKHAVRELRELYLKRFDIEQEVEALQQFRAEIEDAINTLEPGDKTLLRLRHRDGMPYEQIACRECGDATESMPRKRLKQIEKILTDLLRDSRSSTRAVSWPFAGRFVAGSRPDVGRS